MTNDNERIVRDFIAAWSSLDVERLLGFFAELGLQFPQFPYVAHSRGWSAEDMENNERHVQQSTSLHDGAAALVERCAVMARGLVEAAEGKSALVRGGRKGMRLDGRP